MSQDDAILNHLKSGKSITAIEALNLYSCFRLAARIDELKDQGHLIKAEIVKENGKRYAKYQMAGGLLGIPGGVGADTQRKAITGPIAESVRRQDLFPEFKETPRYRNHYD